MSRTLVFSSQVYSVETIKKAAYRCSDVLSVHIIPRCGEIECILHFLSEPKEEEQIQRIVAAFRNEVLDQDLRAVIAKRQKQPATPS